VLARMSPYDILSWRPAYRTGSHGLRTAGKAGDDGHKSHEIPANH
jgi:hypothetical protein